MNCDLTNMEEMAVTLLKDMAEPIVESSRRLEGAYQEMIEINGE